MNLSLMLFRNDIELSSSASANPSNTPQISQRSVSAPVKFSYELLENQLFQIPRLIELANFIVRQNPNLVTYAAKGSVNTDRSHSRSTAPKHLTEIVAPTEENSLLLLIKEAQKDPEYQTLLKQILIHLEETDGQAFLQSQVWLEAYIFIAPPITPYRHPQHGSNYLFQIYENRENLQRKNKHSIFISLTTHPGEERTVSLTLVVLKPPPSNQKRKGSKKEEERWIFIKRADCNRPPQSGARLGKDLEGNPAWFIPDPNRPGQYLQIGGIK